MPKSQERIVPSQFRAEEASQDYPEWSDKHQLSILQAGPKVDNHYVWEVVDDLQICQS
jgi:hypothetical protein